MLHRKASVCKLCNYIHVLLGVIHMNIFVTSFTDNKKKNIKLQHVKNKSTFRQHQLMGGVLKATEPHSIPA